MTTTTHTTPTLSELLAEHRPYHSALQMRSFITTRSGPTVYGMWQQALRELDTRATSLRVAYMEREVLHVDMKQMAWQISKPQIHIHHDSEGKPLDHATEKAYECERLEVRLAAKMLELEARDRNIDDLCREFAEFYRQTVALRALLGDLTDERREELDRETWEWRLKRLVATDYLCEGHLRTTTVELIASLPKAPREELMRIALQAPQEAIDALGETPCPMDLDEYMPDAIEPCDVLKLIE